MNPTTINTQFGRFVVPDVQDLIATRLIENKLIDPWVVDQTVRLAKQHSTVVDVGAYIGDLLIPMACRRPDLQFIAYEVNPEILNLLMQNLVLNRVQDRVFVHHAAVYDGTCNELCLPPVDGHIHGGINYAAFGVDPRRKDGQMIRAVKLDDLLTYLVVPQVSVIKIDAQGSDLAVMRGARQLIKAQRPAIIFEYDTDATQVKDGRDYAPLRIGWEDYQRFIDSIGYRVTAQEYANKLIEPRR